MKKKLWTNNEYSTLFKSSSGSISWSHIVTLKQINWTDDFKYTLRNVKCPFYPRIQIGLSFVLKVNITLKVDVDVAHLRGVIKKFVYCLYKIKTP